MIRVRDNTRVPVLVHVVKRYVDIAVQLGQLKILVVVHIEVCKELQILLAQLYHRLLLQIHIIRRLDHALMLRFANLVRQCRRVHRCEYHHQQRDEESTNGCLPLLVLMVEQGYWIAKLVQIAHLILKIASHN